LLGLRGPAKRTVVAGTLWPEVTEEHAQGSLRTALWRLRRACGDLIDSNGDILSLNAVQVDVQRFTAAALRALQHPESVDDDCPLDVLASGELLPGWDDDWVAFERERLRQLRLHGLEATAARLTKRRRYAMALEAALESARIEPLRESAHRAIVAVHLAENNLVEAVKHYEIFRALVYEELAMAPSAQFAAMLPLPLATT
jgi:DNA-binding SARP family transcriptional activator